MLQRRLLRYSRALKSSLLCGACCVRLCTVQSLFVSHMHQRRCQAEDVGSDTCVCMCVCVRVRVCSVLGVFKDHKGHLNSLQAGVSDASAAVQEMTMTTRVTSCHTTTSIW